MIRRIFFLFALGLTAGSMSFAQNAQDPLPIKTIELVMFTHIDYGYTDNPVIAMDLQKRFIDIVLDAASETFDSSENSKFYWTFEALDPFYQWWLEASTERKALMLKAFKSGQVDINALPFHIHALSSARQYNTFLNWIPQDLFLALQPEFGMMNDVNGFPRPLAIGLLNKGINKLWMSINDELGGAPFKRPNAFWWKMPDGRKLLVWNNQSYWMGYNLFTEKDWRFEQRQANNTQFRTPRINDIFPSDEKSVREAHRICIEKLREMINQGYLYDFIAVSFTNQWRCDNDGPFLPIINFIKEWNQLGLQPAIHFTTVSKALDIIEKKVGSTIKTYEGEWPDWWAFGGASDPRELSASRQANNYIEAILSSVWGDVSDKIKTNVTGMDKDLCLFREHTYASNESASNPYSLFNLGHIAEKNILAYRPYEKAQWLLAQRLRNRFTNESEGLYAVNTGKSYYTGFLNIDEVALRGEHFRSVTDIENSKRIPLLYENGTAQFWVDDFEGNKIRRFTLSYDSVSASPVNTSPIIITDSTGWPLSCRWKGMDKPLFEGIGGFLSLESKVGRAIVGKVWNEEDADIRKLKVKENTREVWAAVNEKAEKHETPYTLVYTQKIVHPRLNSGVREIEIWKNEPRIKFSIQFDRISGANPEIFYITFTLPETAAYPVISNGGNEFLPYKDQIPGTCTDFFTIDGWINYPSQYGNYIWSCRDIPLVSFGSQNFASKSLAPPEKMNKIYSMVYNNLWYCNFPDNVPGVMQFQYDLVWKNKITDSKMIPEMVQTYYLPPVIMINPQTREDKHTFYRMNEIK